MSAPESNPGELESRLAKLHEASFGWALSCCGWNEADAEDALQTTYVKVISGTAHFRGQSEFKTWLFGVIRHTAHEQRRRDRSQRERAERLVAGGVETEVTVTPADHVELSERSRRLLAALDGLPAKQREVLHLVFYEDLTIREAAAVMEVSIGTARVHYHRGKMRLKALLASEDGRGGKRDRIE